MKTITAGKEYQVNNFEDTAKMQTIVFAEFTTKKKLVEQKKIEPQPAEDENDLVCISDGTTVSEVLKATVTQLANQNQILSDRDLFNAMELIDTAILKLDRRARMLSAKKIEKKS